MLINKNQINISTNYNINDLVDMFKVSNTTIYRWIKTGKLQGVKDGRDYFITQESLKEFLEKNPKYTITHSSNTDGEAMAQIYLDAINDVNIPEKIEKELRELMAAKAVIEESITLLNRQKKIIERFQLTIINRVAT